MFHFYFLISDNKNWLWMSVPTTHFTLWTFQNFTSTSLHMQRWTLHYGEWNYKFSTSDRHYEYKNVFTTHYQYDYKTEARCRHNLDRLYLINFLYSSFHLAEKGTTDALFFLLTILFPEGRKKTNKHIMLYLILTNKKEPIKFNFREEMLNYSNTIISLSTPHW